MRPPFQVGDIAWVYVDPRDRPRPEREFYCVVLRSLDVFYHSPSSAWLVTSLREYAQGSTDVHSVPERRLYKALWTFTGYLRLETTVRDHETTL